MTISKKIETFISQSSFIRKMFEEGARLKAEHGAENVFDFSLGNPDLPPPSDFDRVLYDTVSNAKAGDHSYMPNTGYRDVCESVAAYLSGEQGVTVEPGDVIMTVGAAGALNVALKAILDPGDEVITPTPCFVEYGFYADNHGGNLVTVPTRNDFTLDLDALAAAINSKTKAVLINSPNNPTGQIYGEDSLKALGNILKEKGQALGRTIYLISDEPYRKIVFDGATVPSIFASYADSILATSYSKDLSIPGERIGFVAVSPTATFKQDLINGMALTNRILGYVNAPALMQKVVGQLQGACADVSEYKRRRDLLCDGLADAGYEFIKSPGTFYLFPRSPIQDDVQFAQELQKELILVVPGSGFKGPGYFRIAFCVGTDTIAKAMPGFRRVMQKFK